MSSGKDKIAKEGARGGASKPRRENTLTKSTTEPARQPKEDLSSSHKADASNLKRSPTASQEKSQNQNKSIQEWIDSIPEPVRQPKEASLSSNKTSNSKRLPTPSQDKADKQKSSTKRKSGG
jgi:hypothetical protein